jgi:thioredoxin reductase
MSCITIVGLGAIGSHAAVALRNHSLRLVDFDKVEHKNVLSQNHFKLTTGQTKARSLDALLRQFGNVPKAFPVKLEESNVAKMLTEQDLVLDCTDNIAARTLIQAYCVRNKIPCLHGGMSADGTFGVVMWTEHFIPDKESGTGATCEDGENVAFHTQLGATIAYAANRFLKTGDMLNYYLSEGSVLRVNL